MDSWRQISDCLPAELTARIGKKAGAAKAPASATGQRRREGETRMVTTANPGQEGYRAPLTVSRHRRVTSPNGSPRPVARLCLVIDNGSGGGRREEGGPCVRRLRASPWRERARELKLVVHSAASRTCVCEAAS